MICGVILSLARRVSHEPRLFDLETRVAKMDKNPDLPGPIPVILIQIPITFSSDQYRMDFSVGAAILVS
jgi:hypothetical protein